MEEINLKEVYNYFKTKILYILIAIVAILVVGNIYTLITRTPLYRSNTTIVLVNNKENYNQSDLQLNKNLIGTYSEIVKSRKVLSKVVENLKLKTTEEELSKRITVSSVENTEIIKISVDNKSKKDARKITDEVAKVFAEEIKDIYHLENVSIVDKAVVAKKAYNVNYVKDNLIYLVAGLVLSCGVVFVIYYFDTTIKSSEVVEEKFGLTVIGIVPEEEGE